MIFKKILLSGLMFFLVIPPHQSGAITSLTLDGASSVTITPPAEVLVQGNFSAVGGTLQVHLFQDQNGNRLLDPDDLRMDYYKIIDGVYSQGRYEEGKTIRGDDNMAEDGEFLFYYQFPISFFTSFQDTLCYFVFAKDQDLSSRSASLFVNLNPESLTRETPYVYGSISDSESGLGIPQLEIHCQVDGKELTTITNAEGHYWIPLIPDVEYLLQIYDYSGLYPWTDSIPVDFPHGGDSLELNLELTPYNQFITGVASLLDSGPAENIVIVGNNSSTYENSFVKSNALGEFELGVRTGDYFVFASAIPGIHGDYRMGMIAVEILPDSIYTEINFSLERFTCFIEGRVTFGDGQPVSNINVTARKTGYTYFAVTHSDGYYKIAVTPDIYSVSVSLRGYQSSPAVDTVAIAEHWTESGVDFVLSPASTMPYLSGRVTNSGMETIYGARVLAYSPSRSQMDGWLSTTTDSAGSYTFEHIPTGIWYVAAYHPFYDSPEPAIREFNLSLEDHLTGQDFILSHTSLDDHQALLPKQYKPPYPNPFNGLCIISAPSESYIEIYDIRGIKVLSEKGENLYWEPEYLSSGIYFVKINRDHDAFIHKVIYMK
ncbi:carboxypeptidase regulatory-like domain-containing protein [bacterium]|nr:carboxypeptidase regulatory-like domain-containing protein [bacterium]